MKKESIKYILEIHEKANRIAKAESKEESPKYKEDYVRYFKNYLEMSETKCVIKFKEELKEAAEKEKENEFKSFFEYGYISQKIKSCREELERKKNQGGKREGAGRHKLKIPNKRMGIAIDLADVCKNITDAYQSATPEKRKLIVEYLKNLEGMIK